jgi:hypothetical protein
MSSRAIDFSKKNIYNAIHYKLCKVAHDHL